MEMSIYNCFSGEDISLHVWERDTMPCAEQNLWAHVIVTWTAISFFDVGSLTLALYGDTSYASRITASAMFHKTEKLTLNLARLTCWKLKFCSWCNDAAHAARFRPRPPTNFTWWRLQSPLTACVTSFDTPTRSESSDAAEIGDGYCIPRSWGVASRSQWKRGGCMHYGLRLQTTWKDRELPSSRGLVSSLGLLPARRASSVWPSRDLIGLTHIESVAYGREVLPTRRQRELPHRALVITAGLISLLRWRWRPPTRATHEQVQGWLESRRPSYAPEAVTCVGQSLVPWRGALRAMWSTCRTVMRCAQLPAGQGAL